MLKCAFPDGIPEEEYWSVMVLLHPYMSFRTIRDVLAVVAHKDLTDVYLDAMGFGLDPMPDPADVEKVKQKLDACGYQAWVEKNTF
jgi:hypothetical protein